MIREVNLDEISDGRLYGLNDMVKADCNDCKGCSACCRGMGQSIVLDPLDVHRLCVHLHKTMEELLSAGILELNVVDGVILPNIAMTGVGESCRFLDENGRCSVHYARPGICRLFPLGRYYEEETQNFRYFLQTHECHQENRTKIKVKKWIDTPEPSRYDQYIADWHFYLKKMQAKGTSKETSLYILKTYYLTPYNKNEDFYEQYRRRKGQ
jgi:hypothetical protein